MALFTLEDNANNEQFYCGINTAGKLHFGVKIGSNCSNLILHHLH